MAKSDNIFNIRGRLGDFIFIQFNNKHFLDRSSNHHYIK